MTGYRKLDKWLVVLAALHGLIACGGFFAPYDPVEQDREHAYARPMRLHLVDRQGNIHARPFFTRFASATARSINMTKTREVRSP